MNDAGRLNGLPAAVQFLTRVPVRLRAAPDLARSVPWFPVVGGAIGAAIGGVAAGTMHVFPASVAAAVAVIFGVALTGAFHEDGLADTMDALGGTTPQRRREILKDSRHGSYGVAAMCSTIVLRIVCVAAVGPAVAFGGLVAAHALGRGTAVVVMGTAPPVPEVGLGSDFARSVTVRAVAAGAVAALVITVAATGWWVLPLVAAGGAAGALVTGLCRRAFGGVSGDILGAVEQVVECAVLVTVTALARHHRLWWA